MIQNPESTATGMFQMVEDTWAWQIAKSKQPETLPWADAIAYLKDMKRVCRALNAAKICIKRFGSKKR